MIIKVCKSFNEKNFNFKILQRFFSRLVEVGKFETPKQRAKYKDGQLFMHKIFGYRGVILFPWVAKVYDHNALLSDDIPLIRNLAKRSGNEQHGIATTFYQVLIDQRDCPYIRAQPESVTFLGSKNDISLYAIPGLDYVHHDEILPYISSDSQPIQHELFEKFLKPTNGVPAFEGSSTLQMWHEKNHKWLEISDVHRETTEDIRVTVAPFYMGSRVVQQSTGYWWRYTIRLENLGNESVQLRERHWRIFSFSGTLETVRGRGVVGQEPLLSPANPAFQYSSHVSLQSPSGQMWGTYRMVKSDGTIFEVRIPPFALESKEDENN
ncbi:polymerase delta-interacting protein 2 isoform X3 [Hydra vulgaris]|uniref:Polymerase delta-interacting protein 2 isoform X3 n=1 Tax=Hydra vulgaris TaxID=6087 RepID=A0ABM4CR44_HYDVU